MSLASLFVKVSADTNNFRRGMNEVKSNLNEATSKVNFFANTLSTAFGTALGIMATKVASTFTNTISWIKKTGEEFNALKENSLLAFTTMLNSADQAKSFLADLQYFAEHTPFELPGLIEASQKMLAFGFSVKDIIPDLTAIGDAVAGLGGSREKLERVIIAIGQIKAKGKVQAQEMLQLAEAGIPAWDMLAKKLGTDIPGAMKLSEKGAIQADVAISGLIEGMNAKFSGLMKKQSKGFTGLRSTLNDLLRSVASQLTKPWFEQAKKNMERMIKLLQSDKFQGYLAKAVNVSQKLSDTFTTIKHTLFDFIGHGVHVIEGLFGKNPEQKITPVNNSLKNLWQTVTKVFGTIKNIAGSVLDTAFRSTTRVIDNLYRSFNKLNNKRFFLFGDMSLSQFLHGIKSIFDEIRSGGKNLNYWLYTAPKIFQIITRIILKARDLWNSISGKGIQDTLKGLGGILTKLGTTLAKLVRPFKEALGGLFNQLATMRNMGFADIFKTILSSIGKAFMGFIDVVKKEFWPTIKSAFWWVWDNLVAFVTGINWGNVWQGIVTGFNAIVNFVKGIDWGKLWELVWSGLTTIGNFLTTTVFPALSSMFSYLVSWFTDPAKRQILWNAITATWNFITDWASKLWGWVSPYLSSFFGYLSNWVTDPTKRQQIWSGITSAWNWLTDWAIKIWDWVKPYLSAGYNWLISWFIDPNKRQQIWNSLVKVWDFITEWGSKIWGWLSPKLSAFFTGLVSWIIDPNKRQQLWTSIVGAWGFITEWGGKLWDWVSPKLTIFYNNLKDWLNQQEPGLGTELDGWKQSFVDFATQVKNSWNQNWPTIKQVTNESATSIIKDMGDMLKALKELLGYIKLDGPQAVSDWTKLFTSMYVVVARVATGVVKAVSSMVQAIVALKQAMNALSFGDFQGAYDALNNINNLISNFQGTIIEDIAKWIDPLYWMGLRPEDIKNAAPANGYGGYAKGGFVNQSGMTLVGERGPELVKLNKGERVYTNYQTSGMMQSNNRHDVYIHNNSKLPIDRQTVKELAIMLQRELNLNGSRVAFVN